MGWVDLDAVKDPEGAKRFVDSFVGYSFGKFTTGVPSAIGVGCLIMTSYFYARYDRDPELVYNWVKWMDVNHELYKDSYWSCKYMTLDLTLDCAASQYLPMHPGTVEYLKEKGLWTKANEARQQHLIDLTGEWIDAYQVALALAEQENITVDPANEDWMRLWGSIQKEYNLLPFVYYTGL